MGFLYSVFQKDDRDGCPVISHERLRGLGVRVPDDIEVAVWPEFDAALQAREGRGFEHVGSLIG
jgi:hypothetical protein